eukprot:CAMPEP_0198488320 /NCGR_PEP_ID=MMETSP1462-20131121/685_1 /TAXON_ID=1333877 /ORGANISM="Brandtodinium nutriculum, Strain RCC3387" /LENGTH=129 /DNA_ID=CAMNT_0044216779 /DNA_START=20 /DNA_END=406 /DNA_ORIENTATION=-
MCFHGFERKRGPSPTPACRASTYPAPACNRRAVQSIRRRDRGQKNQEVVRQIVSDFIDPPYHLDGAAPLPPSLQVCTRPHDKAMDTRSRRGAVDTQRPTGASPCCSPLAVGRKGPRRRAIKVRKHVASQ